MAFNTDLIVNFLTLDTSSMCAVQACVNACFIDVNKFIILYALKLIQFVLVVFNFV